LGGGFWAAFFAAGGFFGFGWENHIPLFFNEIWQLTKPGTPIAHPENHG